MRYTYKIAYIFPSLFLLLNSSCLGGNARLLAPATTSTATAAATGNPTAVPPTGAAGQHTLTFVNSCVQTIWVGALNNSAAFTLPNNGGWELAAGASSSIVLAGNWGGRFWGRTGCSSASGTFKCDTGDCSGLTCDGRGGQPASLAEFLLSDASGNDFYDLSLVDAFNLPIGIAPQPNTFTASAGSAQLCGSPTCSTDINTLCPPELQQKDASGQVVACLSACSAENTDATCCRNAYDSSAACPPTPLSELFKNACNQAYSYAFDDKTSTYTCAATAYTVTFCPTATATPTTAAPTAATPTTATP